MKIEIPTIEKMQSEVSLEVDRIRKKLGKEEEYLRDAEKKVEALNIEVKSKENYLKHIQEIIDDKLKERESLESNIADLKINKATLETEISQILNEGKEVKEELSKKQTKASELETTLAKVNAKLIEERSEFEKRKEDFEKEFKNFTDFKNKLKEVLQCQI